MTRPKFRPPSAVVPKVFSIDWPPGFVSGLVIDPRTKKFATPYEIALRTRMAGGWDKSPVAMGGSRSYIASGPVEMMERSR